MGAYRYLVLEQWPMPGVGSALDRKLSTVGSQQPIHRGRTDARELCRDSRVESELGFCLQNRHVHAHQDDQSFPTLVVEELPEFAKVHGAPVRRRPGAEYACEASWVYRRRTLRVSHQCGVSAVFLRLPNSCIAYLRWYPVVRQNSSSIICFPRFDSARYRAAIALVIVRFALIVIPMCTPFIAMNRSIAYGKIVR